MPGTDKSSGNAQGAPKSPSNASGQPQLGPVRSRFTGSIRCPRNTALVVDANTALENILKQTCAHTRSHNAVL